MNIIITWNQDRYFLDLADIFWFLVAFILCLLVFCIILGVASYLIARVIDRLTVKHKITYIDIGDNGEKLLLVNTSDIDGIKSYLAETPDCENVKYIFSFSTEETYKVIGGIDLIPVDHYDKDK